MMALQIYLLVLPLILVGIGYLALRLTEEPAATGDGPQVRPGRD